MSFVAVIAALMTMDLLTRFNHPARATRARASSLDGSAVRLGDHQALRTTLLLTAIIGTLSFNFQVTVSLMARKVFDGDAGDVRHAPHAS